MPEATFLSKNAEKIIHTCASLLRQGDPRAHDFATIGAILSACLYKDGYLNDMPGGNEAGKRALNSLHSLGIFLKDPSDA